MAHGFAPAKINLTLHVTGQRADGYHLLDSLVMFASVGDELSMYDGPLGLDVSGPQADGVPTDARNSILKAAQACGVSARFSLVKNLPSAAGIGGGTADAACALRLMAQVWPDGPAAQMLADPSKAVDLGADVPVSLPSKAARMRGIGEQVELLPDVPNLHAVLVNPGVEVSTANSFKSMKSKGNHPMVARGADFTAWLKSQRNDMQAPAIQLAPIIADVLAALQDATLARMSGSGATCFGIYPSRATAQAAATRIAQAQPNWWVAPCLLS